MKTALVIPSLGAPHLEDCLEAVASLDPAPDVTSIVLSGNAMPPTRAGISEVHRFCERLGFAAAVNTGIQKLPPEVDAVALLNDDALPRPEWLGTLAAALSNDSGLAAVQGTSVDQPGSRIDGRGIEFDRWGLPVQIERGSVFTSDSGSRTVSAVSATAALYRVEALRASAMTDLSIFDERFDCYHEDLDLGLRLTRTGWRSAWVGGAPVSHMGSATGPSFLWRHPWWVLANRWRAIAGNLTRNAFIAAMPRLYRGEIRAARTIFRHNRRAVPAAIGVTLMLPKLVAYGWHRLTPGPRLESIPGVFR